MKNVQNSLKKSLFFLTKAFTHEIYEPKLILQRLTVQA